MKRKIKEAETLDHTTLKKPKGSGKKQESGSKAKESPKDASLGMRNLMTSFFKAASPQTTKANTAT